MRKPWVFMVALWYVGYVISASAQCPSKLPKACTCQNGAEGFRVTCSQKPDINEVMNSLKGDDSIDRLDIRNCEPKIKQLNVLPSMKVRSLSIINCGIESIGGGAFVNIANDLEELRITNNSLTTVPLMGILPKLRSVNFNNNHLTTILENCFNGCPQLRQIRVKNNKICMLLANSLNEVKNNLEIFDISGNCLSAVPLNLRNAFKLTHLDLSENKITELNQLSFMNLVELKELRFNSNGLKELLPMAFVNVPLLSHLFMKENKLSKLDSNFFNAFKELEHVDLSGNELISIPIFKNMSKLKTVDFDRNHIRRIEIGTFLSNPSLHTINLVSNDISHIAVDSFQALDKLSVLHLANNSLTAIEPGSLNGMKGLTRLNVQNNSLAAITNSSLSSLPSMSIADFAYNKISHIEPGSFEKQNNLVWLDLRHNEISSLEPGTFQKRIQNILLAGNKINCDEKFDWFISYVSKNHVETFVPSDNEPEITCSEPPKYAGVPIKDVMIKKANDSFTQSMNNLGFGGDPSTAAASGNMLASVLPALLAGAGNPGGAAGGFLGAVPLLRNFPGMNFIPEGDYANPNLNFAVEQFSEPLVRFATGAKPVPGDIQQMMHTLPNLIVNIPGVGDFDISKIPGPVLEHVLRGGQIPGIPREALDKVVSQYTRKMYDAAVRARENATLPGDEKYLPPLASLPPEVVSTFVSGRGIPYLDPSQMRVIQDYYTSRIPQDANKVMAKEKFTMIKLLPPDYNISKISPEVITQIFRGEMPDFRMLPQDIIDYLRENGDTIFTSMEGSPNIEEILRKLPRSDLPRQDTTAPYDINKIEDDLVLKSEGWLSSTQVKILSGVVVGLLLTVALGLLGGYLYYLRKQRMTKDIQTAVVDPDEKFNIDHVDAFTPTRTSTLRYDLHDSSQPYLRVSPRRNQIPRQDSIKSSPSNSEIGQNARGTHSRSTSDFRS